MSGILSHSHCWDNFLTSGLMVSLLSGLFCRPHAPRSELFSLICSMHFSKTGQDGLWPQLAVQQSNMWFDIPSQMLAHPVGNHWISTHGTHAQTHTHTSRATIVPPRSILRKKNTLSNWKREDSLSTTWLFIWHEFILLGSVLGKSTTRLVSPCLLCPWNLNWRYFV